MASINLKLENTKEYSLSQLFSTPNRKIIIPDFQRDYCWGDKSHGDKKIEIVSAFLDTLIEEHKKGETTLGKIDVYENPTDHIYLTDGQQRLTTLYFIIGMLCKKVRNEELNSKLKQCLISKQEESHDDKEPYLQYAIRESSLFFLRDLVNDFFIINKEIAVEAIGKLPWYFKEYDLDPTIISMINALQIIERKLKETDNFKLDEFADFIINKVKIQYYDVQDRKHGEERFVIINTTGKNLSVSENIKPILLGNIDDDIYSKQWEDRENFFWNNRKEWEYIADDGVNDFLIWSFQIIEKQESIDLIKKSKQFFKDGNKKNTEVLLELHNYFIAINDLIGLLDSNPEIQKQFKFINEYNKVEGLLGLRNLSKDKTQNILLPLLSFMVKSKCDENEVYRFIRRLRKNYFDKIWKERNDNYLDWRYILQIIEKSDSLEHILNYESEFNEIQNVPLNIWFNTEEKLKASLQEQHLVSIEKWEDHKYFMGDLSFLFKASLLNDNESVQPELLEFSNINFTLVSTIFENYQNTIGLIKNEQTANSNKRLANLFRLFRVFIGCNKVEHIYKASWDFEGVLFSTLNRNHLKKLDFMKLLRSNEMENYCTDYIISIVNKDHLFEFEDFNVEKFIKSWLVLKVFNANRNNVLLSFWDGNETGIAAYRNKDDNKLSPELDFSIENSICGYGVRSGFGSGNKVRYAENKDNWLQPEIIDSPFATIDFENFHKKTITLDEVDGNKRVISEIKKTLIYSANCIEA
ncbi:DUF262 domain-containing protein [Flavobacterium sp. LS2P90]|uniref:DUF262 domain-containing protein n=1 Tax=Flavobacterium xylosi TaxID=3230415 RepID=A0ABW6HYD1_9FLAO